MLRYCLSSCTSSHTWCYATVCRLALPHRHDAKLLSVVLHFLTDMMLRYCLSSCTSSQTSCKAIVCSSCTSSQTWCYVIVCCLALLHIHDATLLSVVLHFLTDMMQSYCMFVLHFLTRMMLRYCLSSGTSSQTWCYATVGRLALPHRHGAKLLYVRLALPHRHDATLLSVVLHFFTYMMLRYCLSSCTSSQTWCKVIVCSSCTSSQTWCYVIVCRLALPHRHDATLLSVVLHFLTHMMLRYCLSSGTSSQTWCYATVGPLALPHRHDAKLLYVRLALPHRHDATSLSVVLHFFTYMMLRYCLSSCTSSQTWCYATVCRLALLHIHDATLLSVVLHFRTDMMQSYCMFVLHFLTDMMQSYCMFVLHFLRGMLSCVSWHSIGGW